MPVSCAGCGEEFSPWAPRCPACGRSAVDAVAGEEPPPPEPAEAADPPAGPAPPPPAGAPEPPSPAWLRRHVGAAVAAAVALVGAAVAGGLLAASGPSSPGGVALPAWVRSLPGRVVSLGGERLLVDSDADGLRPTYLTSLGGFDPGSLVASPDGRYLIEPSGALLATDGWRVVKGVAVPTVANPGQLGGSGLLSDGDAAVVGVSSRPSGITRVSVELGPDHRVVELGAGRVDGVSGDPRAAGAFLTVYAPGGGSDVGVELADAGSPARTVVTAEELRRYLHIDPSTPVFLSVYPDLAGDKLAVAVSTSSAGGAVLIVSRSGRVLSAGPQFDTSSLPGLAWSPDGRSVAYPVGDGSGLAEWSLGAGFASRAVPEMGQGSCLWSPDSEAILCPTSPAPGSGLSWAVGRAGGGAFVLVPAPGSPLAWLSR